MNLNRCERCGSFFASKNSVCPNCQSKDEHEINHLKTFVNRFLQDKNVYTTLTNLGLNSEANKIHNISL